jgi:hypothetical protein
MELQKRMNEDIVKSGSGRQLILMGDMNVRTGRKNRRHSRRKFWRRHG